MASYRKKPCKKSQVRNPETGRCIKKSSLPKVKRCRKGYRRSPSTGTCKKIKSKPVVRRRSAGKFLKKSVAEGECRGRTKASCNKRPGCSYRKSVGCVKKFGVVKRKYVYAGPKGKSPSGSIRGPRREDYDNADDYTDELKKRMAYAEKHSMRFSPVSK